MSIVFQSILQMSFKASFVIIAVLVARLLLRKAPVKYSYMLWAIVALRLCCPVLPQSPVSFFSLKPVKEAESYADAVISEVDTAPHASDAFTPIPETRPEDSIIYPVKIEVFEKPDITIDFIPYIWAIVAMIMLAHGAMTYAKLYKSMADATLLEENVMCSARVPSPFILGFVKPRIYIPYGLEGDALGYVLNHERYHISRGDHILRPVSYMLLCIHWFNPLVWSAFYLMGRDMEMSCDEAVMARYPRGGAAYSETLLSFAAPRIFAVTPCLSESDVGRRIRHILSWKKPTLWVTAAAAMLCIAACALFVFDRGGSDDPIPSESSSELYNLLEKANQSISLIAAQDLGDYINRVEAVDYQKIRFFELLNDLSEYEYISSEPPLTKGDLIFELYIENGSQYKLYRAYSNALFLEFINPNGIHIVSYYEFNVKEASDILYTLKELRNIIFNSPDPDSTFFYINLPHKIYHPARITTAAAERAMTEAIEQNRIYDKDERVYFTMQFHLPSGTYLFDPNTYAAAVVLPDGTQTVYYANLWSFDYRLDMATPISGIGAEEALLSLKNSVTWKDDGKVYFMIPATYAPKTDWNIHISGRIVDGNMSMGTHYFEDVNLQKRWQPGYSYSIELNGHESLTMEAYLPDGQGGIHEISIDLMPPANMGRALFEYDGKTYDLALRESSVNALGKTTEISQ
ncbi:MAG: hypothetical protein IIW34_07115, partial [Clostridia bacterium]|nr:hypothetical protein [Clostridia bacterium]